MEVTTNTPSAAIDPNFGEEGASKIKQTLGAARRRIKQIDLRQLVVDNPLPAVGIGLAVGAIVGLARPMPKQSRVAGVIGSVVTAMIYKTVKDMAFSQLGTYAREFIANKTEQTGSRDASVAAPF